MFFTGFGPRRAAVLAERTIFSSFAIIIYHPKEHSLRVSAFNSNFFLKLHFGLYILRSAKLISPCSLYNSRLFTYRQLMIVQNLSILHIIEQYFWNTLLYSYWRRTFFSIDSFLVLSPSPYWQCFYAAFNYYHNMGWLIMLFLFPYIFNTGSLYWRAAGSDQLDQHCTMYMYWCRQTEKCG